MKKILAFGASSSKNSINKQFATYVAHQFKDCEINIIDLNNFIAPIFSVDIEEVNGIPESAYALSKMFSESDLIIISLAEHNGSYTAAYKNIIDWVSRVPSQKTFDEKKMLLLSTSPGARGGASVLKNASETYPYMGADIIGIFSLPSFTLNFSVKKGITDPILKTDLLKLIENLEF